MAEFRESTKRNDFIYSLYKQGYSLTAIAQRHSLTVERIRQIVAARKRRAHLGRSLEEIAEDLGTIEVLIWQRIHVPLKFFVLWEK